MASEFDDANYSCPSRSYFKKTVSLQDWWLTKPQTDDDTKTLGVAGLTCTSQLNRAGRCFSSAPIVKVYDFMELETVDGVCVILQGYINKARTLENGFSSEVFEHFVIGFPPYWEEFSTSYPKRGSAAKLVLGECVATKDFIEGHDNVHDSVHGKVQYHGSYTADMGVQDSEDTVLSNKTSTVHDASSLEFSHEHIIKDGYEVSCERYPLTSEIEDDPSLMVSPMGINDHIMKHEDNTNYPLPKNFKCSGVSSRRTTRSMTKMATSKNHSTQGSLLYDISNLDKVPLVDPENLGSSDIQRKDTNDTVFNNKAVNVVDCDGTNLQHFGTSSLCDTSAGNLEVQNSRSPHKRNSSSSYGVKCENRKNISTSEEKPHVQNLKNVSSNLSVEYGKGSNEVASYSKDTVLRIKSKQKQNDHNVVNVTEDQGIKSTSQVGICYQRKTEDADVSSESQIGSDPLNPLSTTSVGFGCLVNATTENVYFAPNVIDLNNNTVLSKTSMETCQNEKGETAGTFTDRDDVPDKEGAFNAAAARQEIASKEGIMTRSKSKRKLTSVSSRCEMGKGKHIRSPKSAKSTSRLGLKHSIRSSAKKVQFSL